VEGDPEGGQAPLRRARPPGQPRVKLGYDHLSEGYSSPQRLTLWQRTDWGALGFAAYSEEGFSGQNAGDLPVIVDEASGITDPIWSAIHGLVATRIVVVGNPIRYDCHFREPHELAATSGSITSIPISSLECPDAEKEHSPVGMASQSFLRQMREIHGEDSPWWRSNILGLFSGQESVRFLPLNWLDACANEKVLKDDVWLEHPAGVNRVAVDVAGGVGADKSVIVVRNDKRLLEVFASEWHGVLDDARERLEQEVVRVCRKWDVAPNHVICDKGGLGRDFGSYLARYGVDGAVGYFGAGRGKLYVNRRTANAFAIKRRLDPNKGYIPFYCGGIPEWPALRQELAELRSPTMEMEEGQVGQILEEKAKLADRLHRSQDHLDAFLMTFTYYE
jgi:hypothetical protein